MRQLLIMICLGTLAGCQSAQMGTFQEHFGRALLDTFVQDDAAKGTAYAQLHVSPLGSDGLDKPSKVLQAARCVALEEGAVAPGAQSSLSRTLRFDHALPTHKGLPLDIMDAGKLYPSSKACQAALAQDTEELLRLADESCQWLLNSEGNPIEGDWYWRGVLAHHRFFDNDPHDSVGKTAPRCFQDRDGNHRPTMLGFLCTQCTCPGPTAFDQEVESVLNAPDLGSSEHRCVTIKR